MAAPQKKLTNAQNSLLVIKNKIAFFDDFTNDEVLMLAKGVEFKKYKQNEIVFEQNEKSKEIYYIINGSVQVLLGNMVKSAYSVKFTNHVPLAILRKRAIFGEMAPVTNEPRSARIVAHEDGTTLLKFAIDDETREDNKIVLAYLYQKFVDILSEKLKKTTQQVFK
jgi:CRP-like cAMP-binding protein